MTALGTFARLLGRLARPSRPIYGWYRRLDGTPRRVVVIGTPLLLVAVCAVVAGQGLGAATPEDPPLEGRAVSAEQLTQIQAAALSCPALTPARLAGQIMAISQFDVNAKTGNGGEGLAGLTAQDWQQWSPWPEAKRLDPAANIVALAHRMCDLVGQLREAGVGGDAWRNALAASVAGVPAVVSARGVPGGAPAEFVDTVGRYEGWYVRQPGFLDGAPPQASASPRTSASAAPPGPGAPAAGTPAMPLPDSYVASVLAAGRICPTITPVRVAAQLMASSGFNPNLLDATGAQGVAQFLPEVWTQYASAEMSPWDPTIAIPTLGTAMCDLVAQFTGLGEDPYVSALTAFRWGPNALRQAGGDGVPAGLREFATTVIGYADYYAGDAQLGGATAAGPADGGSVSGPVGGGSVAGPVGGPVVRPTEQPPPARPAPPAKPVVNLALNRNVVASSFQDTTYWPHQNFPAYLAVDGNGGTRWSSLAENPSWIYVDLGAVHNVVGAQIAWETAYSKNYEIHVSNDAVNWITVYQDTSGNGGTDQFTFTPVNARYVKVYSLDRAISTYGVSLWEFEVLGT